MRKKSGRKSNSSKKVPLQRSTARAAVHGVAALLLVVGATIVFYSLRHPASPGADPVSPVQRQPTSRRPFYENPDEAKPFPATLDPSRFGITFVARAYEIAQQIPDVLVQQPCDCNCGVLGHRSLLDCYASSHAANCSACLQEAVFAHQLTAAGRTPAEIRADIDRGLWRTVDLNAFMR